MAFMFLCSSDAACFRAAALIRALGARLLGENWITLNSIMRVINHANLSPEAVSQLEGELSGQQNLNDVMKWALSHPKGAFIPSVVANVIVQDEFTHDVIIPYRDGLVLVYDTT
jgi:hypothetical protein